VITVLSATGGCGKTFFATNLAYHLHTRYKKRTLLIDLDLQFGELSTALRLKPKYTISDLVSQEGDPEDLAVRLEDHLLRHESGIYLLAAPDEPADADGVEPAEVARVIDAARTRFDYVVVDSPAALSEPVLGILDQTDRIFALATLDLPSIRNLGVLLTTLSRLKIPADGVTLLLNKVEPDVGIDVAGVSQYFPQGFSMVIPYGREVNRSLNMGQPSLAYAPRSDVSKALEAGLDRTLALAGAPGAVNGDDGQQRRRFGRRRTKAA
jgi:pilus assembly protein CpaE